MSGRAPGEQVTLRVNHWDGDFPVEGDFIRTTAGSCYLIDALKITRDGRLYWLRCTKLEHDAVAEDAEGVHLWGWSPRASSHARARERAA
jgi:hypothetical protein